MIDPAQRRSEIKRAGLLAASLLGAAFLLPAAAQGQTEDGLWQAFQNPPQSARPRVWWHWMNGNVTKAGIAKDLDWMKRAGIGGMQNFDATQATPTIVGKRLIYMTPEWKDAFRFAADKAAQLDLELAIASSPGWSETGGPWVQPQDAMKKLVWTETDVRGGTRLAGALARPSDIAGPYQDSAASNVSEALTGKAPFIAPHHYANVAVMAYRIADDAALPAPRMTLGGKAIDAAMLLDDSLKTGVDIDKAAARDGILIDYGSPRTIRSATIFVDGIIYFLAPDYLPHLEASGDGKIWRAVADIPVTTVPTTVSFPEVTARYYRVSLKPQASQIPSALRPAPGADMAVFASMLAPKPTIHLADLRLSPDARINRFEAKAAFVAEPLYDKLDQGVVPDGPGVAPADVIDLTSRMMSDGTLDWVPPRGRWRIVRLGWSLTGKTNHPATAEATGLEVDKYDGAAVRAYLEQYLAMYRDAVGDGLIGGKGVRAMLNDSIEAGPSNWTPRFVEQFTRLRGYDPRPWLPTVTGAIIGSRAESDAFLYDFRRTLADLIASEHYGTIATVGHEHGLTLYSEAVEGGRPLMGDDMAMRSHADVPMAAMWAYPKGEQPPLASRGDLKGASSVAHVYGQNLAAAESFTSGLSPWAYSPDDLRPVADYLFLQGINRPIVHTSVHVPGEDRKPGLSLSVFGQFFNRNETWAEMARPWMDYLARSSLLLQQGRDHADVAYFYGEDAPITVIFANGDPIDVPTRYAFDMVNADVLLNQLSMRDGDLVTKGGAHYKLLYLGGTSAKMTLQTLQRIGELVKAGATIVGEAPKGSPSLKDDPAQFRALADRLWGKPTGKGRIIAGTDVEAALAAIGVVPDFTYTKPDSDSSVLFAHRTLPDGEIYFVSNRKNAAQHIEATFRVAGKTPEI